MSRDLTVWHSFKRKVVGMTQCKQLQAEMDSYLSMVMLYKGKKKHIESSTALENGPERQRFLHPWGSPALGWIKP